MPDSILVENLGKRFCRYHTGKPTTIMEAALSGFRRIKPLDYFWALRGVSFKVKRGEMLGVIGHNGAGKSTLLQLLGKVAHPDEGQIQLQGRIGALLELGAGFHGDLTGRENVYVAGIVAGLTKHDVTRHLDRIVAFAELEKFIDNPVRTYSSGMMMRLAFSVASHTYPDILLVDEVLSVGDLSFQTKCLNRIHELKSQGCSIVLVSHDVSQVERLCDRALWLRKGEVAAHGDPVVVTGQYVSEMRSQTQQRTIAAPPQTTKAGQTLQVNENRFGSLEVQITDVRLLPAATLRPGDRLCVEVDYQSFSEIENALFNIAISDENGMVLLDVNTLDMQGSYVRLKATGTVILTLDRLDLRYGNYFVDIGIYAQDWAYAYDFHWHIYPLNVEAGVNVKGIVCPPMQWDVI